MQRLSRLAYSLFTFTGQLLQTEVSTCAKTTKVFRCLGNDIVVEFEYNPSLLGGLETIIGMCVPGFPPMVISKKQRLRLLLDIVQCCTNFSFFARATRVEVGLLSQKWLNKDKLSVKSSLSKKWKSLRGSVTRLVFAQDMRQKLGQRISCVKSFSGTACCA